MRVYSSTLNAFTSRMKALSKEILSNEMGLSVRRSRFLFKDYLYSVTLVAFESSTKLGYFNFENFQIGINKNLVYMAKPEILKNILRHELAHMYVYLLYRGNVSAHGPEYRQVCRDFGWGAEVYKAYADLEEENTLSSSPDFEKVLSKVKKLLNLATSANHHEAALATTKANELLMKYNLEFLDSSSEEEEVCVLSIYQAKRTNIQMSALYRILEHFYVQPVFNREPGRSYLEVVGSKSNVELADYIAKFLTAEFERLYKLSKLKGAAAKNSFIRGIADGFSSKLISQKKSNPAFEKELIKLEKVLENQVSMVYSKLGSSTRTISKSDLAAHEMGIKAGANLSINEGLSPAVTPKKLEHTKL